MLDALTNRSDDDTQNPDEPDAPYLDADPDTIGHIVGNERRRLVIRYLDEHGPAELDDLADHVADQETDGRVQYNDRKNAYVALYQHHMDKLDGADIVAYDADRKTVTPARNLAGFAAIVDIVEAGQGGDAE